LSSSLWSDPSYDDDHDDDAADNDDDHHHADAHTSNSESDFEQADGADDTHNTKNESDSQVLEKLANQAGIALCSGSATGPDGTHGWNPNGKCRVKVKGRNASGNGNSKTLKQCSNKAVQGGACGMHWKRIVTS